MSVRRCITASDMMNRSSRGDENGIATHAAGIGSDTFAAHAMLSEPRITSREWLPRAPEPFENSKGFRSDCCLLPTEVPKYLPGSWIVAKTYRNGRFADDVKYFPALANDRRGDQEAISAGK